MPQRSSAGRRQHFIGNPGTRISGTIHVSGSTSPEWTDPVTATWTNATSAPTNLDLDVSQMASAIVYVNETAGVGGSIDFLVSGDGTNFDAIIPLDLVLRVSATSSTHAIGAGDKTYSFNVSAYKTLRTRLSVAITSGTVAITARATSAWGHGILYTLPANAGAALVDTELPAAVLLTDNTATPTAPAVGSFGMLYDGAAWDFARGTSADGALVNLGANNDVTVTSGTITTITNVVHVDDNTASLTVDNPILSVVGGGTEATAQRVTIATDSTGVLSVNDNSGSLTIDNATLSVVGGGAEATALRVTIANDTTGSLSVFPAYQKVDNGPFTDGSSFVATAGFILDEVAGTALTENDVGAARIDPKRAQVLVIEDETTRGRRTTVTAANALKVDNSAVTQPISGTIAATQSGTWTVTGAGGTFPVTDSAGSLTVDAPVDTPVFVRLSDGAAAITTLPVSLASVPSHAVTNAGTFVVQENGAALTSLQLIDDVVVADDAAFTPATTKVAMAGFTFDDVAPDSVNEGDAGAARMSANRNVYTTIRDAAGNERGANVTSLNELVVSVSTDTSTPTYIVQEDTGHFSGDPGIQLLGVRRDAETSPVSANNDYHHPVFDNAGQLKVRTSRPATPAQSTVASSASSTTLVAANTGRHGATIYNDSTALLYLKLGATASTTSFTAVLTGTQSGVGGYYEVPFGYTGIIDGIWVSATGNARITELTT